MQFDVNGKFDLEKKDNSEDCKIKSEGLYKLDI